ncbi:nucleotidyltransferase domain-containing protein [Candidatus Pacearchaeota archaeon]|nr:nucleotidyltransferase domain-containing protein [Candidatus Pacearchaeota archaeon]
MAKEGRHKDKHKNQFKDRKIKQIFSEQLSLVKPGKDEHATLKEMADKLKGVIGMCAKNLKIKADCFVGGSLAKGTIIKKDIYDLDIFVRFEKNQKEKKGKKQEEDISKLLERILKAARLKYEKIHGSRDYFIIQDGKGKEKKTKNKIFFEIVPVLKIRTPKEAENTTDLSFFHISYIMKETKRNPKLADEIMLAKAFCHAQGCYGAESYIKGFSGYALELLVCNYRGFLNFIRHAAYSEGKIIIDKEKLYKNRQDILINLNEAKLQSPVVLVDPTFRERNALASLSAETFEKFKKSCADFLRNPSKKFFEKQETGINSLKKEAKRKKAQLIMLSCSTGRQAGDIAGSKLLKFFYFISSQIERYFDVSSRKFVYSQEKTARLYFVLKRKKQRILSGPPLNLHDNVKGFKKEHKNCFARNGRIYAKEKLDINFNQFFKNFKKQNAQRINDMGITKCFGL